MGSPYRWVILAIAIIGFMQTHVHRMSFPALIPAFIADLGLSYAAAGTIQTAYFWTYASVQVPIGIVADRWGPRRVMLVCMGLLTLGSVWFASSGTYWGGVFARMLVGLGAAAIWVPSLRLVAEWFPADERGRAAGLIGAGGGTGGMLGFVLAPWLSTYWGWRWAYGSLAAPAFLTFVLIALFVRSRADDQRTTPVTPGALGRVLRTGAFWPYVASLLLFYGGYFSFLTFLPAFFVTRLGASEPQAGFLTSLIPAGTIVSWPLGGMISDRMGRRKPVLIAGQALVVVGCLVFALAVPHLSLTAAGAVSLIYGLLLVGMIVPFVMIAELFPRELAATASGVLNGACFAGVAVLPILLGRVVDVTGSFVVALLVIAGLEALALGIGLTIGETGPGRPRPPARAAE